MTNSVNYAAPNLRSYTTATNKAAFAAAVILVLLLGALCEVEAVTHFGPDYRLDAAEMFVAP
jgi:hypothetical protein